MLEIQTPLMLVKSPEDNELQITFDVTATAKVREYVGGDCEPGEFLIEDIEIIEVRCWSIRYGTFGTAWPGGHITPHKQSRLSWLNYMLDERDDWTEAIRIAATREHMRSRDQVRE